MSLPERIRAVRIAHEDGTQRAFAEKIGVTTRSVIRWENNKQVPTRAHAAEIAAIHGLPLELFTGQTAEQTMAIHERVFAELESMRRDMRTEMDAFRAEIRDQVREDFAELLVRALKADRDADDPPRAASA